MFATRCLTWLSDGRETASGSAWTSSIASSRPTSATANRSPSRSTTARRRTSIICFVKKEPTVLEMDAADKKDHADLDTIAKSRNEADHDLRKSLQAKRQ